MTWKKTLLRGLLGFPLGIFVSYTVTILISLTMHDGTVYFVVPGLVATTGGELSAVILQYFLSGIMGFAFALGSCIFEVEHWSITKQTVLHFLLTSTVMITIAYVCQWVDHTVAAVLLYFAIYAGIYAVIWVVQVLFWRRRIAQMNRKLK